MTGTNIAVTVSRLPDSTLDELETSIAELHDEYDLDPDNINMLRSLIIGYGAAWDAVESLQQQVNTLTEAMEQIVDTRDDEHQPMVHSVCVEIAEEALQSIKESPREEQGK